MSTITSRLPARVRGRSLPRRLGGIGVVNGLLGAALVGAGDRGVLRGRGDKYAAPRRFGRRRSRAGVVLSTISATGSLQAAQELSVGLHVGGDDLVGRREGRASTSSAGRCSGRSTPPPPRQALQQAEASLATAKAQYEQTLTGETAQQRKQDALSVTQSQAVARDGEGDREAGREAVRPRRSRMRSGALRTDQGQEKVDLYQQKQDQAVYRERGRCERRHHRRQGAAHRGPVEAAGRPAAAARHSRTSRRSTRRTSRRRRATSQQAQAAKDTAAAASAQNQVDDFTVRRQLRPDPAQRARR